MFKKLFRSIVKGLSGFIYDEITSQISQLDSLKPKLIELIREKLSPEKLADKIIDSVQEVLTKVLLKIFHREPK